MAVPNIDSCLIGKADSPAELPVPEWARTTIASNVRVGDPLTMYAGGRMMAFGSNNARGRINWFWRKPRMARGANEFVQGRMMVFGNGSSR